MKFTTIILAIILINNVQSNTKSKKTINMLNTEFMTAFNSKLDPNGPIQPIGSNDGICGLKMKKGPNTFPCATYNTLGAPWNNKEIHADISIMDTYQWQYNYLAGKTLDSSNGTESASPEKAIGQSLTAAFRKEIVNFRPNYTLNAYVLHPTIQKYKALSSNGNTNLLEEIQANSLNIAEQCNAVFEKARDLLQAVHKKISIHQYRNIINRIASNFARDTIPEAQSQTVNTTFPNPIFGLKVKGDEIIESHVKDYLNNCKLSSNRNIRINPEYTVYCMKLECMIKCTKDPETGSKCILKNQFINPDMAARREDEAFCKVVCANPWIQNRKTIKPDGEIQLDVDENLSLNEWDKKVDGCKDTQVFWESCLNYGPRLIRKMLVYQGGMTELEVKVFLASLSMGRHNALNEWQQNLLYPAKMPDQTTNDMWVRTIKDYAQDQPLLNKKAVQERCHQMRDLIISQNFINPSVAIEQDEGESLVALEKLKEVCSRQCKVDTSVTLSDDGEKSGNDMGYECKIKIKKDDISFVNTPFDVRMKKTLCRGMCPALPNRVGDQIKVRPSEDPVNGCCQPTNTLGTPTESKCSCCASIGSPKIQQSCIDDLKFAMENMLLFGKKYNAVCSMDNSCKAMKTTFDYFTQMQMNVYNGGIIDDEKAKFLNDWKCALDKIKEMVKRLQAKRINKSPSSIDPLTDLNASVSEYDAQKKQDINKALLSFSKLLQDAQNNPNQLNKLRQLASQIAPQNPLQTAPVMAGETVDQEAAPVAAPAAAPVAAADGTRFKQKKVRTAMDSKL